jgi:hypothetical protein
MQRMMHTLSGAVVGAVLYLVPATAFCQTCSLHGQASGWGTSTPDGDLRTLVGVRYIPEITIAAPITHALAADVDVSVNFFATYCVAQNNHPSDEAKVKPYRASLRLSSDEFELRLGLQKINFGSAMLLRSLMWFDRMDPRDPLQLTDGVYGALARYYFLDNTNVWIWGLYGNSDLKGWEYAPTKTKSAEFGGRLQIPLWTGELGMTYHHRTADFSALSPAGPASGILENRFALDGKWDLGIGLWFEAVVTHDKTEIPRLQYQRQWTLGADYTVDVWNGVTALLEHYRIDNPENPLGSADGRMLSALSLSMPLGLLDRVTCVLYRDWHGHDWYRLVTWQRSYDDWSIYLLGFWNPEQVQLYQTQEGSSPFAGKGIQLIVVFNH